MAEKTKRPTYVDDITVRELWAEAIQTIKGPPGTLKLEFRTFHWAASTPNGTDRVTPVARIALPISLARVLRDQLTKRLEAIDQRAQLVAARAASEAKN